jgi:hypothetical protein
MGRARDLFVEEKILGAVMRLLDEPVNYYLAEMDMIVPRIDVCGMPGREDICPQIVLTSCERFEKERIVRLDAYSLTITFEVPDSEEAESQSYAYGAAFERALDSDPTLQDTASRILLVHKKYIAPKHEGCGEGWKIVITLRITIEGKIA